MSEQLDLSIALKKLHELGQEEGDLGCAYWYAVSQLLRDAQKAATRVRELEARIGVLLAQREGGEGEIGLRQVE